MDQPDQVARYVARTVLGAENDPVPLAAGATIMVLVKWTNTTADIRMAETIPLSRSISRGSVATDR